MAPAISNEKLSVSHLDLFESVSSSVYDIQNNVTNATLPEPEPRWSMLGLVIFIVATALGNALVCLAVSCERRLQNMNNYFLMSLAFADLLVATLVMPLAMIFEIYGYFPYTAPVCIIWSTLDVCLCTTSIWHMCIMSMDRYFSLRYPIRYGRNRSKRMVVVKITAAWIIPMIITVTLPIKGFTDYENIFVDNICAPRVKEFVLFGSLFAFYVPLIIMLLTYGLTINILRRNQRKIRQFSQERLKGRRTLTTELRTEVSTRVNEEPAGSSPQGNPLYDGQYTITSVGITSVGLSPGESADTANKSIITTGRVTSDEDGSMKTDHTTDTTNGCHQIRKGSADGDVKGKPRENRSGSLLVSSSLKLFGYKNNSAAHSNPCLTDSSEFTTPLTHTAKSLGIFGSLIGRKKGLRRSSGPSPKPIKRKKKSFKLLDLESFVDSYTSDESESDENEQLDTPWLVRKSRKDDISLADSSEINLSQRDTYSNKVTKFFSTKRRRKSAKQAPEEHSAVRYEKCPGSEIPSDVTKTNHIFTLKHNHVNKDSTQANGMIKNYSTDGTFPKTSSKPAPMKHSTTQPAFLPSYRNPANIQFKGGFSPEGYSPAGYSPATARKTFDILTDLNEHSKNLELLTRKNGCRIANPRIMNICNERAGSSLSDINSNKNKFCFDNNSSDNIASMKKENCDHQIPNGNKISPKLGDSNFLYTSCLSQKSKSVPQVIIGGATVAGNTTQVLNPCPMYQKPGSETVTEVSSGVFTGSSTLSKLNCGGTDLTNSLSVIKSSNSVDTMQSDYKQNVKFLTNKISQDGLSEVLTQNPICDMERLTKSSCQLTAGRENQIHNKNSLFKSVNYLPLPSDPNLAKFRKNPLSSLRKITGFCRATDDLTNIQDHLVNGMSDFRSNHNVILSMGSELSLSRMSTITDSISLFVNAECIPVSQEVKQNGNLKHSRDTSMATVHFASSCPNVNSEGQRDYSAHSVHFSGESSNIIVYDDVSCAPDQLFLTAETSLANSQHQCYQQKHQETVSSRQFSPSGKIGAGRPRRHFRPGKRRGSNERKASKVLGIIFAVFVVLWLPFFTANLIFVVCDSCVEEMPAYVGSIFLWFGYASSLANPIIYTMFSTSFRTVFYRLVTCKYTIRSCCARTSQRVSFRKK